LFPIIVFTTKFINEPFNVNQFHSVVVVVVVVGGVVVVVVY